MCVGCGGLTDPCTMLRRQVCLTSLSRNLEGELGDPDNERRECRKLDCVTLTSVQSLILKLADAEECDQLPVLDGAIEVRDLVHVFDGDGNGRGMHSGEFRWQSSIGLIMGRLAGITNAGTHRAPVFRECQRCRDAVMEGQFHGTVCRPRSPEFADCQLFGAYRLRIDPRQDGLPAQGVRGTWKGCSSPPAGSRHQRPAATPSAPGLLAGWPGEERPGHRDLPRRRCLVHRPPAGPPGAAVCLIDRRRRGPARRQ